MVPIVLCSAQHGLVKTKRPWSQESDNYVYLFTCFQKFQCSYYYDYSLILECKVMKGDKCCREIMHAMWKPQKFKYIYLMATLYVFTLTIPSAAAVYWAFGDELLNHSNAFSLLPKNGFRDTAVILMLIHQVNKFLCFVFSYNM